MRPPQSLQPTGKPKVRAALKYSLCLALESLFETALIWQCHVLGESFGRELSGAASRFLHVKRKSSRVLLCTTCNSVPE